MENVSPEIDKLLDAIKNDDILEATFLLQSRVRPVDLLELMDDDYIGKELYHEYDVSESRRWEDQPLILASFLGKLKFVEIMLNLKTTSVDLDDKYKRTALFYACQQGHLEVVRHLLKSRADINLRDCEGNTPLHEAIHFRRVEVVRVLVVSGANCKLKNHDNLSALDLVCQRMMTSDDGKLKIHREMFEIIVTQRKFRATREIACDLAVHGQTEIGQDLWNAGDRKLRFEDNGSASTIGDPQDEDFDPLVLAAKLFKELPPEEKQEWMNKAKGNILPENEGIKRKADVIESTDVAVNGKRPIIADDISSAIEEKIAAPSGSVSKQTTKTVV